MSRNIEEPSKNERGEETHPAFGMASVHRVSSTPGASLFDSEIRHSRYVVLRIDHATRKRDLNRDWIQVTSSGGVAEIAMSEAQWAALVSSMNTSGIPVTIRQTETDAAVPELPFEPRMAVSQAETNDAAHRAFEKIREAFKLVEEKPTKANLRTLRFAIENAPRNVEFAAESLTKHAEDVVQKARADIEAMVVAKAEALGIDAAHIKPFELEGGELDD